MEPHSVCGQCGEKAEQVSYLNKDALITSKRKRQALKNKILFNDDTDFDLLCEKVEGEIVKLAELENTRYKKEDDDIKRLLILQRITVMQQELMLRSLVNLDVHFRRFFGP